MQPTIPNDTVNGIVKISQVYITVLMWTINWKATKSEISLSTIVIDQTFDAIQNGKGYYQVQNSHEETHTDHANQKVLIVENYFEVGATHRVKLKFINRFRY